MNWDCWSRRPLLNGIECLTWSSLVTSQKRSRPLGYRLPMVYEANMQTAEADT